MEYPGQIAHSDLEKTRKQVTQLIAQGNAAEQKHFDVIVLGMGSMGSSTCYQLAKQGVKVLGIDQFDIPHEKGAHTGQSRIIRKAYFEHPAYVPLLDRAYQNWKELEYVTGMQVYFETGLLYCARPGHILIDGVRKSAAHYNIELTRLTDTELQKQYAALHVPDHYEKLFEPGAGFVRPELAIALYTQQSLLHGAQVRTQEKVLQWNRTTDGIEVQTSSGVYHSKKLVITAGPWAGKMIPVLAHSLQVTRQVIAWVKTSKKNSLELGKFPCWMIADDDYPGVFYGFPVLPPDRFEAPTGFKLAHHFQGASTDPDAARAQPSPADEKALRNILDRYFPGTYESTEVMKTCLYTNTPDEHFILDFLPGYAHDVVVAAGFSGHGFKFASVIGEIISDLVLQQATSLPIGFLNLRRLLSDQK